MRERRRGHERERELLEEKEMEKEDDREMMVVKGRGTKLGEGSEPSKEGAERGGRGMGGTDPGGVVATVAGEEGGMGAREGRRRESEE